jgi:hypothetical protein
MSALVRAQERNGRDIYQEQLRVSLDQQRPDAREVGFDYGGWFNFALFNYDDAPARRHRMLRQFQLRGWASMNIHNVHRGYFRALLDWEDWNSGDNPDGRGDDFFERVERAWYEFDLGRLMQRQSGQLPPVRMRVKVGRQFTTIGTAFVLSMPMDAIRFDVTAGDWEMMALLGNTIKSSENIDEAGPVATHQDRCFYGFEVRYRGFDRHRPFAYYLAQSDHTKPDPRSATQKYDYSSRYFGIGSEGSFLLPDLSYSTELVGQVGETYSEGRYHGQDDICAMAFDARLQYLFRDTPTQPMITAEYIWASGDSDRRLSSTSTLGGNQAGTNDYAFNAFGFRDTGIAFAPEISNIHIYTVGASCFPLQQHKLFRKMEVGTKIFFYNKSVSGGPISDTTATANSSWLGWEWDVYCNWRITSDLAWTLRYGAFMPGAAYESDSDSCRQFLYSGIMFSF